MKLESAIDYILERLCKLEAELAEQKKSINIGFGLSAKAIRVQHYATEELKVKIASIEKEIEMNCDPDVDPFIRQRDEL